MLATECSMSANHRGSIYKGDRQFFPSPMKCYVRAAVKSFNVSYFSHFPNRGRKQALEPSDSETCMRAVRTVRGVAK